MRLTMEQVKKRVRRARRDDERLPVFPGVLLPAPGRQQADADRQRLFAMYQQGYQDLNSAYNGFWADTKYGTPPRSCFALSWIPGNSLIEVVGAAAIASSATRPA